MRHCIVPVKAITKGLSLYCFDGRDMCSRTKVNHQGLTAYEMRNSTRTRRRFQRPSSSTDHRFLEKNLTSSLQLISITTDDAPIASIPNDWLRGHTSALNAVDGQFMISLSTAPRLLRKLIQIRTERESRDSFEVLIRRCVENIPTTKREKIIAQYDEYKRSNSVTSLLTIYTSDIMVHGALRRETNAYAGLLFLHLNELAVLLTHKLDKKCVTAIDLYQLSEFGNEEEVLLLPFTLFKVDSITIDPINGRCHIVLLYVPLP